MRPRLPDDQKRNRTVEVWLLTEEIASLRHHALALGLRRKVAGSDPARYRGDLSKLIHRALQDAAQSPVQWRAVAAELRRTYRPAEPEPGGSFTKVQMRVKDVWHRRIRRLAEDVGIIHGGRGNTSAFLREVLRWSVRHDAAGRSGAFEQAG